MRLQSSRLASSFRRLGPCAAAALTVAVVAPSIASAAVGRTSGITAVSRLGEETYTIPIAVPPGVKGLAPQLELTYQHRRGEVHSGVGWVLAGLSSITRCPKTVAQDGVADSIRLTTTDRFCLDGNRLRLTSGTTYGALNTSYRLQTDTAARVTVMALGAAGDPDWFKVEQKNGLIYEYGHSANSRIESLAAGKLTTAHTWVVSKIADREGNSIVFTYQEDTAPNGGHRLTTVDYTSNTTQGTAAAYRVSIVYEPKPAGDLSSLPQYLAGGAIRNDKRIDRIDITHLPSSTLVRRYELTYEPTVSSSGLSRLQSVQECAGSVPDCFSPITFGYANGAAGVGSEIASGTAPISPLAIDINGDGRTDIAYSSTSTSGTGTWMYQFANASGGFGAAVNSGITNTNYAGAIAINYDGDGKDDILVRYSGTTWWVIRGSTAGLLSPVNTTSSANGQIAMDWNGDAWDDLMWSTAPSPNPAIYVNLRNSNGAGFAATATRVDTPLCCGTTYFTNVFQGQHAKSRVRGLDANGDGIRDFMYSWFNYQNTTTSYGSNVLLGAGKGALQVSSSDVLALRAGDINADGYTDVVYLNTGNTLYYRLSTGLNLAPAVAFGTASSGDVGKSIVRDWSGDGFDDLLVPIGATNTWTAFLSTGNGLAAGVSTGVSTGSLSLSMPMDLNGDGLDDIGYIKSTGQYAVLPHATSTPDLLNSIIDGYGNTIAISHLAITQGGYTPGTGATFPSQNFQGPIVAVRQIALSDGIGGTHTQTYDYTDARINVQTPWQNIYAEDGNGGLVAIPNPAAQRGLQDPLRDAGNVNQTQFIGFSSIKVTDSVDNLVTVTDYSTADPPFTGVITGQRTYQPSGTTPIATVSNTWVSKDAVGTDGTHYLLPYLQQSLANEYEVAGTFNGALKRTATTTLNAVDGYGTATTVTRTVTEPAAGANGVQPGASYTTQTVLTSLQDSVATWCFGKPGQIQTTASHNQYGGTSIARTVTQVWDVTTLCRLNSETTEPLSAAYALTRTLGYDGFGNVTSETLVGKKNATTTDSRQSQIDYITGASEPGRLPVKVTNPAGEVTALAWDYAKSVLSGQTDPNGIGVTWQFDAFGRRTREDRAVDGTATAWTYNDCTVVLGGCLNGNNKTVIIATALDKNGAYINDLWSYFDRFDRVLTTTTRTLGGSYDRNDREYSARGLLARIAAPCIWANCTFYWTTPTYDLIGRPTQISRPISATNPTLQTTNIYYEGLTARVVDPESKQATKIMSATGATVRSVDHNDYYQNVDFDAFGSLLRVTDSQSNTLLSATFDYGAAAFRRTSVDMDMGSWSYTPNAFGEAYAWNDAKGQSFSATFDKLSRPLTRVEPEGTSSWVWGASAVLHNVGQLTSTAGPGYSESYNYDATGQRSKATVTADAVAYVFDFAYHATQGFLESITYPTSTNGCRVKVQYGYQYGYAKTVTDVSPAAQCTLTSGTVLWQANAVDAHNQVTQETLGNGLVTSRAFDAVSGVLQTIQSGVGGGTGVQSLGYLYDRVGNVLQRQDNRQGLTENFYYDNLHRLDYSTLNGNPTPNVDLSYDVLGNIIQKTDVAASGAWTYDAVRKHRLLSAAGGVVTFSYDANGNAITRNGSTINWTSYNYPSQVNNGSEYSQFFYGPNRERWKQVYSSAGGLETTISLSGLLEIVTKGGVTDWRHYLYAAGQPIVVYSRKSSGNTVRYVLRDHLGSIAALTTSGGALEVNESFTAFGQRRNGTTWQLPLPGADDTTISNASRRGFTDHNHLGGLPLIHMNGRIEDALTGRFLSADPYVPAPGLTQAWNRYSYVNNNPLGFIDPSGFREQCIEYRREPGSLDSTEQETGVYGLVRRCFEVVDDPSYWLPPLFSPPYPTGGGAGTPPPRTTVDGPCLGDCHSGGFVAPVVTPDLGQYSKRFYQNLVEDYTPGAGLYRLATGRYYLSGDEGSRLSGAAVSIPYVGYFGVVLKRAARGIAGAVKEGTTVFRVFGGEARGLGRSWTTVNPGNGENFRSAAGLFPENSGQFVIEGRLTNTEGVLFRDALPGPNGVGGGLPELVIPNPGSQVCLICVSGVNPPF